MNKHVTLLFTTGEQLVVIPATASADWAEARRSDLSQKPVSIDACKRLISFLDHSIKMVFKYIFIKK
jgi:hypothetical protein